ncbi:uncharacterized protein LOC105662646 isoform X1 [Megachile rotundata]|uniref:uncharacterized protein LOC105662646 isoform X1 n=2 Tax=Megachile rotundata TaxID=143995 RepID=UPI003FD2EC82
MQPIRGQSSSGLLVPCGNTRPHQILRVPGSNESVYRYSRQRTSSAGTSRRIFRFGAKVTKRTYYKSKKQCPTCKKRRSKHVILSRYDLWLPWINKEIHLRSLGICRRCRHSFYKLKVDLENLGLSRSQVRKGLLQLATKPRVILWRHTAYRRRKSLEKYEKPIVVKTEVAFLDRQPELHDEDTQTPDSTQGIEEDTKRDEKIKVEISSSSESMSSESCELGHRTKSYSFDKALEKVDCTLSANIVNMNSKRSSVIISAADAFKSQNKNDAMNNNTEEKSMCIKETQFPVIDGGKTRTEAISDLTCDKVGQDIVYRPVRTERNRIKLNLKSSSDKRSHAKSDVHKESDTKYTRVQDSVSHQNKRAKQGDNVATDKTTRIEDNLHKRHLCETTMSIELKIKKIRTSVDERRELDRKMAKSIRYKFRSCFGDCGSVSEDEQEQYILQKRCKRRRKKDSVDSCDSGVYFSEVNTVNNNSIEILRDIQKAVPDSTMHEDVSEDSSLSRIEADAIKNVTSDENVKLNNVENVNNTDKQSPNDKCNVSEAGNNKEVHKNSTFCNNNLVQSTTVLNSIETSSKDKKSNTDLPILDDTDADNVSPCSTPKTCDFNRDADITADVPQSATCGSDLRDLSKLLDMDFNETCQVTSNGNVLSIREKDATNDNQDVCNKDTNEDLQLNFASCNQSLDEQAPSIMNGSPSKDTLCLDVRNGVKTIPVRINLCNLLSDTNEIALSNIKLDSVIEQKDKVSLPNSESNLVEEKATESESSNVVAEEKKETAMSDSKEKSQNTQPKNVPRIKLRVLSSAELGSRWCPTPVNPVISTTSELSSTNTVVTSDTGLTYTTSNQVSSSSIVTQAAPTKILVITTTANAPNLGDNSSTYLKKSNMDPKFSEAIYNGLVHIYHLIVSIRATRVDHSKTLLKEFENLRKILNSEDHINLISAVIDILNKELLVNQPLTLKELLHYIPLFKSLFLHKSQEENSNGYQNTIPTIISNMTTKHTMYNNSQGLQSTTSVQNVLQNVFSSCIAQTPVSTNLKEKASVQPQNNLMQNNVPMNSTATNYGIQQPNFITPLQTQYRHRGPPPPYFVRQHSIPVQQTPLLVNPNETGIRYNQAASAPFLYSYLLGSNAYGNVNAASYCIQQTATQVREQNVRNVPCMSQSKFQSSMHRQTAYMPQEVQPQNMPQMPQNIPVVNPTTQTVPNNFVPSAPKSKKHVPKYTQRNETRQNVQMQAQVPHKVTSKQVPPPLLQQTQSQNKQKSTSQISLESTVKQFGVLRNLSDIQKIILLRQINFYFGCTTWLQQQFTTRQWQIIHSQRSLLLHFQTLLKHFVQNAINNISPNMSQSNMFENNILINTENNIQKEAQINVQRSEEIHCPVSTSNTEAEQCKIGNTNRSNVPCQRNLITLTSKDQFENEQNVTGNLPDKQLPNQPQESETLQNEGIQRNKQTEQTLVQNEQSIVTSNLETQKTLDSNIKQKAEGTTDLSQQNLNNHIKIIYNIPYVIQKEVSVIPNSEELPKNTLQQPNPDLTNEENLSNCVKIIHNVPYTNNTEVPIISNLNAFHKDTVQQSNPHLVTVQISSHNYEVRVIDTNAVDETEDKEIKSVPAQPKECEEVEETKHNVSASSCSKNNTCENFLEVHSPKTLDDTKQFSNENISNSSLEGITVSHIADVRSITLEAFEEMEEISDTHMNNSEGNIIEEEMKVCLTCSKPSRVTCSVCLEANYCSQECLRLHWEEHYQDCKPVENSVYL